MLIYCLTLFIVVFVAHLSRKSKSIVETSCYLYVALLMMVLVAGLRDRTVGTDTGAYVRTFQAIQNFSDALWFGAKTYEYGYYLLNWLVHFLSDQYLALLLVIALIVVCCYQLAIVSYSVNIVYSLFVFITMGFYTFFFNGARQGLACAICALTIGPLLERDFKKYLSYVILAAFFHKTALVMIPVYFLLARSNTLKVTIMYGLIGIASALYLQTFIGVAAEIDPRYVHYGTSGEGGGYVMATFKCLLALFFMIFKKSVRIDRERYDLFLNMLIFGTIISIISVVFQINPSGLLRMTLYFDISIIFLWPIVFRNLTNRKTRALFGFCFVMGYLVFFVLTTERFSNLTPYTFNSMLHFL